MRLLSLVIVLFLTNSLFAQQISTEASTRFAMSGLVNPEHIGDLLLVDANSTSEMTPVGIIKVNKEATKVSVAAFRVVDGKWDLIIARELIPLVFVIEKPGNWMVVVRGENVTGETLFNLVVGPQKPPPDDPPPPPPPPLPGDFAQLAEKSKELANALNDPPTNKLLADSLDVVLARPPPIDVIAARTEVSKALNDALLSRSEASRRTKHWETWRFPIAVEIEALAKAGKFPTVAEYFRAIKAISKSLR